MDEYRFKNTKHLQSIFKIPNSDANMFLFLKWLIYEIHYLSIKNIQ